MEKNGLKKIKHTRIFIFRQFLDLKNYKIDNVVGVQELV